MSATTPEARALKKARNTANRRLQRARQRKLEGRPPAIPRLVFDRVEQERIDEDRARFLGTYYSPRICHVAM